MRTPHASPKAPLVLAIVALSSLALHCSAEDPASPGGSSGGSTAPLSGSSSSAAGTFATGGGGASAGSASVPTGGQLTTGGAGLGGMAGSVSGGVAGTTSGGSVGAGGSGGAGGGAAGSGGGAAGPTFAEVSTLLTMTCKGSMCHDAGSMYHRDWATASTLYTNLTTPIPKEPSKPMAHCRGVTPVVPGNAEMSLLYKVIKGKTTCLNDGVSEEIEKMPEKCGEPMAKACLTEPQIKLIADWINAGAKQQ